MAPVTPKIFSGEIKHAPRTDVPTIQGSHDSMNNMFGNIVNQPSVKSIQFLNDNVYVQPQNIAHSPGQALMIRGSDTPT